MIDSEIDQTSGVDDTDATNETGAGDGSNSGTSDRPTGPTSSTGRHHNASTSSAGHQSSSRSLTPKARPTLEQQVQELKCRLNSMNQENRVLRVELDTYKLRCKTTTQENKNIKQTSLNVQAGMDMEAEMISNTLLKKIQELKREKETLVNDYETEEEFLTNDLSRKLTQLRQEKTELERTLEREQQMQVAKLMRRIERMEREMAQKHQNLEALRKEKVDLEQTLEQEQEALVNKLWKRMDKLEREKRILQEKLNQPVSSPSTPPPEPANFNTTVPTRRPILRDSGPVGLAGSLPNGITGVPSSGSLRSLSSNETTDTERMTMHIKQLRRETEQLKRQLKMNQSDHDQRLVRMCAEERQLREENKRLQETLNLEKERSEALCRALSESESSLDGSVASFMDIETRSHTSVSGYDYLRPLPTTDPHEIRRPNVSSPHSSSNPPPASIPTAIFQQQQTGPGVSSSLYQTSPSPKPTPNSGKHYTRASQSMSMDRQNFSSNSLNRNSVDMVRPSSNESASRVQLAQQASSTSSSTSAFKPIPSDSGHGGESSSSVSIAAALAPSTHVDSRERSQLSNSVNDESQSIVSESASELDKIMSGGRSDRTSDRKSRLPVSQPATSATFQPQPGSAQFVKPSPPASPARRSPSPANFHEASSSRHRRTPTQK